MKYPKFIMLSSFFREENESILYGASNGNRTRVSTLARLRSTTELCLHAARTVLAPAKIMIHILRADFKT